MIVERRQDEGKNALRSLVLLVKFLMMLLVSVKHQGCLSSFQLRSRPNARTETRKRKSATRKKGGMRGHERTVASFFLLPFFVIFLRVFHTHSPRLHIGQSNDLTYLFLIISARPPFCFLRSSLFNRSRSLIHTHAHDRRHTYALFSLSYTPCNYTFSLCWSFLLPA